MRSADAQTNIQTNRCGKHKAILGQTSCTLHAWPASKNKQAWWSDSQVQYKRLVQCRVRTASYHGGATLHSTPCKMKQKYFPYTSANQVTKDIVLPSTLNMNCESQVTSNVYQSTSFMMISVIRYAFKYMLQGPQNINWALPSCRTWTLPFCRTWTLLSCITYTTNNLDRH